MRWDRTTGDAPGDTEALTWLQAYQSAESTEMIRLAIATAKGPTAIRLDRPA
jgi:hypothetical protein